MMGNMMGTTEDGTDGDTVIGTRDVILDMWAIDSAENAAMGNLIGTPDGTVMGTIYWHSNSSDILMGNTIIGASNGADMSTMVGTPDCPKAVDLDTKRHTPDGVDMGVTTIY
jgi:hypothetical protein